MKAMVGRPMNKIDLFAPLLVMFLFNISLLPSAAAEGASCTSVFNGKPFKFEISSEGWKQTRADSELKVRDLLERNGDIYLFRTNTGKYIHGHAGTSTIAEGRVSTSLLPDIAYKWVRIDPYAVPKPQVYVWVIRQNIYKHVMGFPSKEGQGGKVNEAGRYEDTLTPETSRKDIVYYDEVKVNLEDLNVIAEVPIEVFKNTLENRMNSSSFTGKELYEVLVQEYSLVLP